MSSFYCLVCCDLKPSEAFPPRLRQIARGGAVAVTCSACLRSRSPVEMHAVAARAELMD